MLPPAPVPAPPGATIPDGPGAALHSRAVQELYPGRFKGQRELLSLQMTQNLHPKLKVLGACAKN